MEIKKIVKHLGIVLLALLGSLTSTIAQDNLVQSIYEYNEFNKLDDWSFSVWKGKNKKFKEAKVSKYFEYKQKDSSINFTSQSPYVIELESCINYSLLKDDYLSLNIELNVSNKEFLKDVEFYYDDGEKNKLVYKLTDPIIDTILNNKWTSVSFSFVVKKKTNHGRIKILKRKLFGENDNFSLRNFSVTHSSVPESNNLIRNPSFEEYYYFPVSDKAIGTGAIAYWNDFENIDSWRESSDTLYKLSTNGIDPFLVVGSDYNDVDDYRIQPYDRHFALEIYNSYRYDVEHVPLNEIRNVVYVQSKLKSVLEKDSIYRLELMILLDPTSSEADNSIGIKFTNDIYNPYEEVNFNSRKRPLPQCDISLFDVPIVESQKWQKLTYTYTAKGGESIIVIGVFKNQKHKLIPVKRDSKYNILGHIDSNYFIDTVKLTKMQIFPH